MVVCSHSDCGDRHKKVGYLRQSQSEEKLLNAPRICCSSDTPSPLEGDGLLDIAIGVACLRGDPRGLAVVEPMADPDNRSNARPGACLPDYSLPRS
jgi:hypothetical protein